MTDNISNEQEKTTPEFEVPEGYELVPAEKMREMRSEIEGAKRRAEWLKKMIDKQEEKLHYGYGVSDDFRRLEAVFDECNRKINREYHNAMAFRDTALIQLSGLVIVIQSALMGGTHHEKNARMRGVLDVLEASIANLKTKGDEWFRSVSWSDGLLHSDSHIPRLQRQVWEQEQELKKYHEKFGFLNGQTEEQEEESPF